MSERFFDVQTLIELERVTELALSPDGRWVAVVCQGLDDDAAKYCSSLWRVELDRSSTPRQLTRGLHNDSAPCFRRDGALGFLSDRPTDDPSDNDSKRTQVWLLPAGGGEPFPLTAEPLGVTEFRFAKSADRLLLLSPVLNGVALETRRETADDQAKKGPSALHYRSVPVRFWDHWLEPAAPHLIACREDGTERRDLTCEADREYRATQWDLSGDGRYVVASETCSGPGLIRDQRLRLFDLEQNESRILVQDERCQLDFPLISPDSSLVAFRVGSNPELDPMAISLSCCDLDGEQRRALAADWDRWPQPVAWQSNTELLVLAADQGRVPIFRIDVNDDSLRQLSAAAEGSHSCVVPFDGGLCCIRDRLRNPPEVIRIDDRGSRPSAALTHFGGELAVRLAKRVSWESLSVASDDGIPVQYFLLRPRKKSSTPLPLLLWIHGGPWGDWQEGWHWRWNPLPFVAAGYAVALPNPRGSTGFGQAFADGIWGNNWGGQCYHDILAVVTALAARPDIDQQRIAAMGGSFGGYMVNWIGGNDTRFKALVSHAGLFSFSAFYGVTDEPNWWAHCLGSNPYDNLEELERYSPMRQIKHWRTPTLVIHGELDYRVPISEALALFHALQHHGITSELLAFPDENHWILKPRNVVTWYETILDFLERQLAG